MTPLLWLALGVVLGAVGFVSCCAIWFGYRFAQLVMALERRDFDALEAMVERSGRDRQRGGRVTVGEP